MTDKFTPGPWEVDSRCATRVYRAEEANRGVAACGGYCTNQSDVSEENEANARLIASAPTLLARLRESTELIKTLWDATDDYYTSLHPGIEIGTNNQIAANETALKEVGGE